MRDQADAAIGHLRLPPPKAFSGKSENDPSDFEIFPKQLKAYLSLQNTRYRDLMNSAEESDALIGLPTEESDKQLARQLQNFLILLCTEKAARVVLRDDSEENGFETWRRLHLRYAPPKRVKYLSLMQKILTWKFNENTLETDLNDWEVEIEKYERSSQPLNEDVKVGLLMSHTPSELQKHLQLNTTLTSRYSEVRAVVLNYCKAKSFNTKTSERTPMEVDAVWRWYQKGKSDAKGKGKGKSDWNQKGKSKSKGKSDGKSDKGKSKGKGKSYGKSDQSKGRSYHRPPSDWWSSEWWYSSWHPTSSFSSSDYQGPAPMQVGAVSSSDDHSWQDFSEEWSSEQWFDGGWSEWDYGWSEDSEWASTPMPAPPPTTTSMPSSERPQTTPQSQNAAVASLMQTQYDDKLPKKPSKSVRFLNMAVFNIKSFSEEGLIIDSGSTCHVCPLITENQ